MIRRSLVLLAASLVGAVLVAAPAQAATYSVTISISKVKADVGQTIAFSGSVSGKKAAKKTVTLQRKVGSGAWKTVGTAKTNKKKKYSFRHKVSATGSQLFRVVAPKKGSTKAGISPRKAFTGWTWLHLSQQPKYVHGDVRFGFSPTVLDVQRPRSIQLEGVVGWQLNNRCDTSDINVVLYPDTTGPVTVTSDVGGVEDTTEANSSALSRIDVVTVNAPYLELRNEDSPTIPVVLTSPRIHCSVAELPSGP